MRSRLVAPVACAALVAAFVAQLVLQPGGPHLTRAIDDVAEMVAAFIAAGTGLWRARLAVGRFRASWLLIALGCGGWAIGEATWCFFELLQNRSTPFPSLADAGFLVFPFLALTGLLVRPSAAFMGRRRLRLFFDVILVSAALFLVSWVTALGQVFQAGSDSSFGEIVSLAYPVSDLILLTVTVVVLSYSRTRDRWGPVSIATGFVALCIADSGFAYLTATDNYGAVNVIDAGWVAGFLVLAVAALLDRVNDDDAPMPIAPKTALLLPYLPAAAAFVVAFHAAASTGLDRVAVTATTILIGALIGRQMSVLLENRALMTRISHQAFHDVLTGLANRALFNDRLEHALDLQRRDMRRVTVLLLDLDDFKTVNDSLGHPAGDELLVRVSERLCATARTGDTIARLGGDEFAILVEDSGDGDEVAARLLTSLDLPVLIAGRTLTVRASVGMATVEAGDPPITAIEMLQRADVAMYAAKRAGKATVVPYTAALDGATEQLDRHTALLAAITAREIDVAYQPIHRWDGPLRGFEALARWTLNGEPVSPGEFLPMARRLGVLPALDELVLTKALAVAAEWRGRLTVSVNLDGETLTDPTFCDRVLKQLDDAGLDRNQLAVEVLESSLIEHDGPALSTLAELRAGGVLVVVDDFGAGYASLVRLQALHPDIVKIDRSLIAVLTDPERAGPLLTGVTQLAHQMGAEVVAEGIETDIQLRASVAAGCDAMQGFLLGRPGTAEASDELARQWEAELEAG